MRNNPLLSQILRYFLHQIKRDLKLKPFANLILVVFLCLCVLVISTINAIFSPPQKQSDNNTDLSISAGRYQDCMISHLSDGDSFKIRCKSLANNAELKVRLAGIDAPEMAQNPWGEEAKQYLKKLTNQQNLQIEIQNKDRYGRYLGNIYDHNSEDIALKMVAAGKAIVYERYNQAPDYLQAQHKAQQQKLGIWSSPGPQQNPELWRRLNSHKN